MEKFRWGIVGFGKFSDLRMGPALASLPGHEIVAVMNRDINKARRYAEEYKARFWYDSVEGLVNNSSIDAVYIASPNYQHCEQTCRAAQKGLHVLCEKPMAVNIEEAEKMVDTCRRHNVKLMIANLMRFHSCHQWAKGCVERGLLGDVTTVRAQLEFYFPPEPAQWRFIPELSGGGAIMDVGVHCIDLLRYLIGQEVASVSAFINTQSHPFPIDLTAAILLRFTGGVLGTVTVSFCNQQRMNGFEISGRKGSLVGEGSVGAESSGKVILLSAQGPKVYESTLLNPYAAEAEHFAYSIQNDQEPLISGEEGRKDLQICLASYESAQENKVVTIR